MIREEELLRKFGGSLGADVITKSEIKIEVERLRTGAKHWRPTAKLDLTKGNSSSTKENKGRLKFQTNCKKKARWVIQVRPGIGTLLRDGVLDWSSFGLSNKLELGRLEYILAFEGDVELIKVEAEQEEMDPRLLETNKVLRKYRSGSAMLLRDLKDYLQDTLRMIPQTRIFSQLDDDKDEDEDYNETIQEEDEEQRRKDAEATNVKQELSDLSTGLTTNGMRTGCRRRAQPEHLGRGPLPMALIPEHQSSRGPTETEGWDAR
ncbi:hypothetical protein PPACK8108_LOCUS3621 [Phakopsora pachyrhizi]|uniref:Uncharacterized protein n=1 Tax=Phakopsora pachyrhizi TaxID=170000 RepID=A0AAV0ALM1_PHAPC|nr:hypothetical protein PPACK8108_LOCUS3621 [Phakopsora pachyrhizi]